ncbi:helix-turn-helix domain-containing protein [Actinosynnema sp. CS-041913]|uniref:helix-turn-helix domain-containing protein n=1 Tax=Actinosynnema sp. CS-041913 TaxID=3239917 RepID=UPI003D8E3809
MARQPSEIMEVHRRVGAALAEYLNESPLTQGDLARETSYHRTSIAHIIAGRQFPDRNFWEKADRTLDAGGDLVAKYDMARNHEDELKQKELDRQRAVRLTRTKGLALPKLEIDASDPQATSFYATAEPIGEEYIEYLRDEIRTFVRLDQQYGGDAASPVILQAYKQMRHRVSTSEIRDNLRRDVYSALSEVAEVAGWSLYDSKQMDTLTGRINHESLSFARLAGDRNMELFVLQNMAMHAETLRRPQESINIAHAVIEGNRLSPRLEVLFRLRLAYSYGLLRAESRSTDELKRAAVLFEDGVRDDDPHWAWWINSGQFSWFEGAVRLKLGKTTESVDYFESSANESPEPRMSFIYKLWAIYGYAVNGSWASAEQALQSLIGDVGVFHSRMATTRLAAALDLISKGNAPSSLKDLALSVRSNLAAST